jgi:hypothetical protein
MEVLSGGRENEKLQPSPTRLFMRSLYIHL